MRISLAVPADNERTPRYMEKALASLHQANHDRVEVILEYAATDGRVGLHLRFPDSLYPLVSSSLFANYPNCALTILHEEPRTATQHSIGAHLHLVPEIFPILRHAQFEDLLNGTFADPVSGILRAIQPDEAVECRVEIRIVPASARRRRTAMNVVRLLDRQFFRIHHTLAEYYASHITSRMWFVAWLLGLLAKRSPHSPRSSIDTTAGRLHDREELVQACSDKIGGHLFESEIVLIASAAPSARQLAMQRLQQMIGAFGAFTQSRLATFHRSSVVRGPGRPQRGRGSLLSHEEVATLFHPPTATVSVERMSAVDLRELEPPAHFYGDGEQGSVVIGRVRFRNDERPIGLALEDRRRHLCIVGKTGMGKTTLLLNQIVSDIRTGNGICLIDPHGDLAESILRLIPSHRTNDVILFDVGDREFAVGFNPLACRDSTRIDQVTSGVVSAFKKLHDSWGPRLEDTLRNAVFAIVEQRGDMMSLMRLLAEKQYRERTVSHIQDAVVRSFWQHEFAHWSDNYRTEAVAAIQNKIRPFLTNTNMRAIVSHSGATLDLRSVMDQDKVLIVNLSKGRVGEDNATLLGAFLVTSIQQAAMTRADIPENERRDFFLYVDEFQNFTTGSFDSVLSEARKYRLSLTVAHQYLSQLNQETAAAVWGNVGSIVAFQVGSDDADVLAQQLSKYPGQMKQQDFTSLPKYTAYARLLIDGMPSNPCSIQTLLPPIPQDDRSEIVRRRSRRQFAPAPGFH